MSRLPRLTAAAIGLAAAACFKPSAPADNTTTITLRADTTVLGTMTFFTPGTVNLSDPTAGAQVTYTNTTSRTFSNVAIALQPAPAGTSGCRVTYPPSADTVVGTVPPGAQRIVQRGPYAPFTLVYVTAASEAGSLVKSWAGRWEGTVTDWSGGVATARAVRGVSASEGQFSVWVPNATTPWAGSGLLVPNRQFTVLSGSNCLSNWSADSSAVLTLRPDSILYRGKAVAASVDAVTFPDSFSLRLGRR